MQRHNLFVITGAGRGFGRAIAEAVKGHEFSKQQTTIVLVGRDSATLEQVAATFTGSTVKTIANAKLDDINTVEQVILPGIKTIVYVSYLTLCIEAIHYCLISYILPFAGCAS
jgi:NADP-dependent 3-hydroxy acid dehydrogenase YdfG